MLNLRNLRNLRQCPAGGFSFVEGHDDRSSDRNENTWREIDCARQYRILETHAPMAPHPPMTSSRSSPPPRGAALSRLKQAFVSSSEGAHIAILHDAMPPSTTGTRTWCQDLRRRSGRLGCFCPSILHADLRRCQVDAEVRRSARRHERAVMSHGTRSDAFTNPFLADP